MGLYVASLKTLHAWILVCSNFRRGDGTSSTATRLWYLAYTTQRNGGLIGLERKERRDPKVVTLDLPRPRS